MVSIALVPTLQLPFVELLQEILYDSCTADILRLKALAEWNFGGVTVDGNWKVFGYETLPCFMEECL